MGRVHPARAPSTFPHNKTPILGIHPLVPENEALPLAISPSANTFPSHEQAQEYRHSHALDKQWQTSRTNLPPTNPHRPIPLRAYDGIPTDSSRETFSEQSQPTTSKPILVVETTRKDTTAQEERYRQGRREGREPRRRACSCATAAVPFDKKYQLLPTPDSRGGGNCGRGDGLAAAGREDQERAIISGRGYFSRRLRDSHILVRPSWQDTKKWTTLDVARVTRGHLNCIGGGPPASVLVVQSAIG